MKKSLTAVAVLGAFCGLAQAQTVTPSAYAREETAPVTVTVYGVLDGGVYHKSNAAAGSTPGTLAAVTAFGSGVDATNRWGMRGVEDLGGGNKATFNLEDGFSIGSGADNGSIGGALQSANGALFDRGATVGLAGDWGDLKFGRNWTPFVYSLIASDASGFSNFGSQNNISFQSSAGFDLRNSGVATNTNGTTVPKFGLNTGYSVYWVNNSIFYTSPTVGGLRLGLLFSLPGVAGQTTAKSSQSASLNYGAGPLTLVAGYYSAKDPTGATTNVTNKMTTLGGTYGISKELKVGASFTDAKDPSFNDPRSTSHATAHQQFWSVNTSAALSTSLTLTANVIMLRDKAVDTANSTLLKVGLYQYLSKRTAVYGLLGHTSNNTKGYMGVGNSSTMALAGQTQAEYAFGVRHNF